MDELLGLERLELVTKVTSELGHHLGVNDKTLAEFIIAQRLESDSFETFKQKMFDMGGDSFSLSLIESIDRFFRMMHPSMKGKTTTSPQSSNKQRSPDAKARVFSGLAMPDKEPAPDSADDAFGLFEALESTNRSHESRTRKEDRDRNRKSHRRSRSPETRKRRPSSRHRDAYDDDQYHSRSRRRHRESGYGDGEQREHRKRRRRSPDLDDTAVVSKIYSGFVTGIKDFGAFVSIEGTKQKADGLVHVSQMADRRINHPSDVVKYGQAVKVKVVSIDGKRIGLAMKDIDQDTGEDLNPPANFGSGANMMMLGGGRNQDSNGGIPDSRPAKRERKRLTSPERWEIRQLIASGVAKASDYPDLNADPNDALDDSGQMKLEEDFDIEIREEEPPFLTGQTKQSLELSPIRVVKAPEGSLNRAATSGPALARERRELQQQEADAAAGEQSAADISAQWNDPMADPGKPKFASDARGAKDKTSDNIPEWKRAIRPKDEPRGKRVNMTIKEQRESLPVYALRDQLIEAVRQNQILIVVGETGSGKTTQTTQYLAEAGFTNDGGMIGCTQPRRVAALSVAKRVAEEVGCVLGEEVGYSIRFEDRTSPSTRIKYMTDGMLQREVLQDPDMKRYNVIMLDEAHERTIATDVLFALLKKTVKKRPDLKIIVTSATLNAEKFSTYFNDAPIFTIPGRTFPVEVLYSREPEPDYLDAALVTVLQIHLTEPAGDILLFLTGQEEIDTSCEILYERMKALGATVPQLDILPCLLSITHRDAKPDFRPSPNRKVVIATNIAETSITIDNIYYVIDPGFVKQKAYDAKLGMDSLMVTPISQAQANQRAGRAGRTGPGKCFRLYTENAYQSEMLPSTVPDIQRQNIATTILMLKAMHINDLLHFDFMDPPPVNTMLMALEELYALGALDDEGLLTSLGRRMTLFPMDPPLAKVLLAAVELGCSDEIISMVAMLNLQNVFYRPKEKQAQADQKKAKFHDPHGDHLTLLNVYNSWKQGGYSTGWCFENFIQVRSMKQAKNIREQLMKIMERCRQPVISCGRETERVRRALCAGFFRNTARRDASAQAGSYKTLIESTPVYLHPSSALFGKSAEWVVYHSLVFTTREYMHWTTSIEPKWLLEAAPTFFKASGTNGTMSKRRQQERIQPLYNKFANEDDWRLSAQRRTGRGGGGTWG